MVIRNAVRRERVGNARRNGVQPDARAAFDQQHMLRMSRIGWRRHWVRQRKRSGRIDRAQMNRSDSRGLQEGSRVACAAARSAASSESLRPDPATAVSCTAFAENCAKTAACSMTTRWGGRPRRDTRRLRARPTLPVRSASSSVPSPTSTVCRSVPQMPAALTATMTSPGAGASGGYVAQLEAERRGDFLKGLHMRPIPRAADLPKSIAFAFGSARPRRPPWSRARMDGALQQAQSCSTNFCLRACSNDAHGWLRDFSGRDP